VVKDLYLKSEAENTPYQIVSDTPKTHQICNDFQGIAKLPYAPTFLYFKPKTTAVFNYRDMSLSPFIKGPLIHEDSLEALASNMAKVFTQPSIYQFYQ
jgi:hypothetical protein